MLYLTWGGGILSYLCPLAGGILSEGDFVQGDFVRWDFVRDRKDDCLQDLHGNKLKVTSCKTVTSLLYEEMRKYVLFQINLAMVSHNGIIRHCTQSALRPAMASINSILISEQTATIRRL